MAKKQPPKNNNHYGHHYTASSSAKKNQETEVRSIKQHMMVQDRHGNPIGTATIATIDMFWGLALKECLK